MIKGVPDNVELMTFDSETTGLYPEHGAVMLQFACLHESGESFNVTIQPTEEEWLAAHPKALEVNGLTWEAVASGIPISQAGDMYADWLRNNFYNDFSRILLVGQNPGFDMRFMWASWRNSLEEIGFPKRAVDVLDAQTLFIVWKSVIKKQILPLNRRTSLKNMCIEVGVEPEPEPHDALQGARAIMRVVKKMADQIEGYTFQ